MGFRKENDFNIGVGTVVSAGNKEWLLVEIKSVSVGLLNLSTYSIELASITYVENTNWLTKADFMEIVEYLHMTFSDFGFKKLCK